MKKPDHQTLFKATVKDPIIANTTNINSNAGNANSASHASTVSSSGKPVEVKFTIRLPGELMGRIRAAYLSQCQPGVKARSLSKWAAQILENAVCQIETESNDGKHFSQIPPGNVPRLPLL